MVKPPVESIKAPGSNLRDGIEKSIRRPENVGNKHANEADHSRALKGLTHHMLAPGAELTVLGSDGSRALMGLTHRNLAPGAELTISISSM